MYKRQLYRSEKREEYSDLVTKLLKNEVFIKDMEKAMEDKYIRKICAFLTRAQMNRFKEDEPCAKIDPIDYDPLK